MTTIRIHPRLRRIFTRLSSLILLLQRSQIVQMLFPEAQILGSSAVANSFSVAVTTVIGLGAYDSVAGATSVAQVTPVSGSADVPVTGGAPVTFLFQITGGGGHTPQSWSVSGTLPNGLTLKAGKVTSKTNTISGTTNQNGNFPITIQAWENSNFSGRSATGSFTIKVTGGGTPAGIATQPSSRTINSGSTTTITVVASGTSPFTYQWYEGNSGTTTSPVGSNSASFTTPALTSNTKYWVKVRNALNSGGANSNAASVTVNQPAAIASQPSSVTIDSGSTTTLSISASGTAPFTYQWYQGVSGNTTSPVGSNAPTFTTPPLAVSTQYWARVTNAANTGGANSAAATVTVRTAYETWSLGSGFQPGQEGPLKTPQQDGVTNLLKFAFNLDPARPDNRTLTMGAGGTAGLPAVARVSGLLRIEYIRRKADGNPGITYTPQCGSDLTGWSLPLGGETVSPIGTTGWERVQINGPAGVPACFGRVQVIKTP